VRRPRTQWEDIKGKKNLAIRGEVGARFSKKPEAKEKKSQDALKSRSRVLKPYGAWIVSRVVCRIMREWLYAGGQEEGAPQKTPKKMAVSKP